MKSVILYYSYTGHTKKWAEKMARTTGADLVEIQPENPKSKFLTFLVDCPRSMMRKASPIKPIAQDLKAYDLITIASPVWASYPTPTFNGILKMLPKGKNVQLIFMSGGGNGSTKRSEHGTRELVRQAGCKVVDYKEVKDRT